MLARILLLKNSQFLLLVLLLGGGTHAAAQTGHPDLDLGIARFALETGNNAMALRYTHNAESEQELLVRARALINTGDEQEAVTLLDRLIKGNYFRGEAALLKSTLAGSVRGGGKAERTELLRIAADKGHGEVRQQALYQLAELVRAEGEPERAGKILASMDPGYWAALGYMNIAADYGKRDLNPSRALIALRVAMAMAEDDLDSARGEALKAELLVRAGLLAYESGDYDKAINFLKQVRLDSYSTPQGLYLHGLALSAKGNQRDAMQSWHRAKKYPLAFPGVAESWLGTGRGYDLTGYLGQAGEAYLSASSSYESERVNLRELAALIRKKGAYEAMIEAPGSTGTEWFLADSRMLTQPRNAYLLRFMEEAGAQEAVERVKDLTAMLDTLDRQAGDLKVFRSVLEERLADSGASRSSVPAGFDGKVRALRDRIVATRAAATEGTKAEAELKQLALTLADIKQSAERFDGRLKGRDRALGAILTKVRQAAETLGKYQARAERALEQANSELDQRMLAYVERENERMVVALDKAEQQIAHLYEYLALQSIERSKP